ncbi:caspase, EACC1-associated type [Streptomyces varsoviensis]|uniref:caspase, EACC1-associated type n=1 Tax=Streptomyces varsoviensis TaxID=67373 RepID=UPI0006906A44|nr:protein kinase [Streptomyces varsoviensis]
MIPRDDIDFGRSRAILLGNSEYTAGFEGRRPMPAALNSLAAMREVLTGLCEWPPERVSELPNEQDSGKLLRTVTSLIHGVDDVLLFYYVGHGLPLPENGRYDLGLALTDTSDDPAQRFLTSLRLRELRQHMERNSAARIKILILDCCCSGIATKYAESAANVTEYAESATPLRGAGTYIWTACGHSQETYFEESGGGLTYFTKFLAEAVRWAHGEQSIGATVANLHDEVRRRLRETRIPDADVQPLPDLHHSGRPDQFLFVRGRAAAPAIPAFHFEPLKDDDPRDAGPYELRARLGAGGLGRVFLAITPDGRPVAVKLLKPELGRDPQFAQRFAREIDVARRVRGDHVARLLDADPDAPEPWLAAEYVCGPSLLELVAATGPLPSRDVLAIARGIARALKDIHAADAVHRDLKPANVMLGETGPRVIDFGIAKSVAATLMTRTNTQLGTPAYKSPEQATGKQPVTPASDAFTLGATIYYLATGQDAFAAEDPLGTINLIAHEEPDLRSLDADVRGLVQACLAKAPEARPTPARVIELCSAAIGPATSGAHPPIAQAIPLIQARAGALRALMTPQPEPERESESESRDDAPEKPQASSTPPPSSPPPPQPVNSPDAKTEAKPGAKAQARSEAKTEAKTEAKPGTDAAAPGPTPPAKPAVRGAVTAVVLLCLATLIWLPIHLSKSESDSAKNSGGSSESYEPSTRDTDSAADSDTESPTRSETTSADSGTAADDATDSPSPTAATMSVIKAARVGDCLTNDGTYQKPVLRAANCQYRAFKVLRVLEGTSDTSGCRDTPDIDYTVGNSGDRRALCLSYLYGSAYHARTGECVYGPNTAGSNWTESTCRVGNFTVKARLTGTSDTSRCNAYPNADQGLQVSTRWSELDLAFCLSMNYPDAAGRAKTGACLFRTGSGEQPHFQAVSCDAANVVVTGRTSTYRDAAACGSYGWATWRSSEFPTHSYTICYRKA